jgi:diacylglycerol kinase (ATP)
MQYDKPMRKMLLLVNPLFEKKNSRDLPLILDTLKQSGAQVEVQETTANRGAGDQAKSAVRNGTDLVIVCGGDGTVFDVIQGMAGSSVPLGIIPFGTGNVLAQNLRIPKHAVAAVRWILAGRPRTIPLGRLTCCVGGAQQSWFFAMTAGMGVHAAMMSAAVRAKKNTSGRSAYFLAGIRLLFHHPLEPFALEITTTSGEVIHRRACEAIAVRVAELNIWRPGGGFDLPFLRLATVETKGEHPGSRWKLGKATYEGLLRAAGDRNRRQRLNAPARYEDVQAVVCKPIPGFDYKVPLAVQIDGEVIDAPSATIEMAGVSVRMIAAPTDAVSSEQ